MKGQVQKESILFALAFLFSFSSVLTLYSDNFFTVAFEQVLTSTAATLVFSLSLYFFLSIYFKCLASRISYFVLILFVSLFFLGGELFHRLISVLVGYIIPYSSVFLALSSGSLIAIIYRFKNLTSKRDRAITYLLFGPVFIVSLVNSIALIFLDSRSTFFNNSYFIFSILVLIGGWHFFREFKMPLDATIGALIILNIIFGFVPFGNICYSCLFKKQMLASVNPSISILADNPVSTAKPVSPTQKPDIYWIILDGYGRSDILRKYNYDNTNFIQWLTKTGFWVGSKSNSNYMRTMTSLVSELNMSFLDPKFYKKPLWEQHKSVKDKINNSKVSTFLYSQGYKTVAFSVGLEYLEMTHYSRFIRKNEKELSSFELQFYQSTIFSRIETLLTQKDAFSPHRDRFNLIWKSIPYKEFDHNPVFVVAHVVSPHPPFVYNSLGGEILPDYPYCLYDADDLRDSFNVTPEEYMDGYLKQVTYVNSVVREKIEKLLSQQNPPVIIIQADHGPGANTSFRDINKTNLVERFGIINAVYLPSPFQKKINLPQNSTPINTFPAVFNAIFETNYPFQPDKSYYTPNKNGLTEEIDITDRL